MRHSERAMQSSLEAANNHGTSLQHRLAQVVAESSRLHQLLFDTQQCLEGIKAEKSILTGKLNEMEDQSKKAMFIKKQVSACYNRIKCVGSKCFFFYNITLALFCHASRRLNR